MSLRGTGTAPEVSLGPSSVPFAGENVGTTSSASTLTLTNTGNAALTVSGLAISGSDAKDSAMGSSSTGNTTAPVAAGKSCSARHRQPPCR
jgi:hypothetical protein